MTTHPIKPEERGGWIVTAKRDGRSRVKFVKTHAEAEDIVQYIEANGLDYDEVIVTPAGGDE